MDFDGDDGRRAKAQKLGPTLLEIEDAMRPAAAQHPA